MKFADLLPILDRTDVVIVVSALGEGRVNVGVLPKRQKDNEEGALTEPFYVSGPVAEVDAAFDTGLPTYAAANRRLADTLSSVTAQIEAAEAAARKNGATKVAAAQKKAGTTAGGATGTTGATAGGAGSGGATGATGGAASAAKPAPSAPPKPAVPARPSTLGLFDLEEPGAAAPVAAAPVTVGVDGDEGDGEDATDEAGGDAD